MAKKRKQAKPAEQPAEAPAAQPTQTPAEAPTPAEAQAPAEPATPAEQPAPAAPAPETPKEPEAPAAPAPAAKGKSHLSDNDRKIVDLHNRGVRISDIAKRVFGFDNEEAVAVVLTVVKREFPEA